MGVLGGIKTYNMLTVLPKVLYTTHRCVYLFISNVLFLFKCAKISWLLYVLLLFSIHEYINGVYSAMFS